MPRYSSIAYLAQRAVELPIPLTPQKRVNNTHKIFCKVSHISFLSRWYHRGCASISRVFVTPSCKRSDQTWKDKRTEAVRQAVHICRNTICQDQLYHQENAIVVIIHAQPSTSPMFHWSPMAGSHAEAQSSLSSVPRGSSVSASRVCSRLPEHQASSSRCPLGVKRTR